ncbi:TonB-dependent receptor [Novosphingobium piscinae]|uniref:TonB-dependent receptor n=2 Tax=Novosphingobium piscinae TaxID=1507448 RepID=A0A7X1KND8_9SPHN|nr:TonB-dependent receptor [Novosphingobium piscinae]
MTRFALLASISLGAFGTPALAQAPQAAAAKEDDKEIVIIGTRRTDRSVTDSASPIDVIGATELQQAPQVNMLDIVRTLVPSFYVPQNTISDASTFVRSPSLRGLGADQILIMINGKRYNRSALVSVYTGADTALSFGAQGADIANIPAIAIKNLQVLRDGATAQYGSDAIGGVINYQLRDDAGIELQGIYGQTYRGDGANKQVSGNVGFKLGGRGFVNLSGEWFDNGETSRGANRPIAVVLAQTNPAAAASIPNAARGKPAQIWGSSPANGYKLFLNAAYEVTDSAKLYLTFNYAHSEADQSFNYRSPISAPTPLTVDIGTGTPSTRSPGRNGAFNPIFLTPCPTGNATCPAGGFVNDTNTFSFASVYPGGFTPRFIGKVDQAFGNAGIKGAADSGLTYDLSATFARNSLDLAMTGSLSASYGPQSQRDFNFGKLIQSETNLNADFTYPLEVGFASPVTLSLGSEYRREQYEKTVGDLQSYGAGPYAVQPLYNLVSPGVYTRVLDAQNRGVNATQSPAASGYGGTSPTFAGTSSQVGYGFYAGAEADVTQALTAGIATRWETYSSFGSALVGKFNFLYRVSDAVSLRGTIGTGFHAPSPGQNNTQIVTTNFLGGNQVQTGTYPTTSAIAQFYGATPLRPERSTNFGAGIVLKPLDGLSLTIDGYSIKVRNRIGISQNFTVTQQNLTALPALSVVGVDGVVNYFTNGFNTSTDGLDVVGNYRTSLAGGPLALTLAYNYNQSRVTFRNRNVVSDAQVDLIRNIAPKHRLNVAANWQLGNFTVNARGNYFGSWSNALEYAGQRFGAKFLTDLDVSYTFAEHYTVTVGANNLFNTFPDRIAPSASNPIYALTGSLADGQIYPRSGGPFGMNGGFWYARLRVKY